MQFFDQENTRMFLGTLVILPDMRFPRNVYAIRYSRTVGNQMGSYREVKATASYTNFPSYKKMLVN